MTYAILTAEQVDNAFDFAALEAIEIDLYALLDDPFGFDAQSEGDAFEGETLGL
jgi:hypothetical protein